MVRVLSALVALLWPVSLAVASECQAEFDKALKVVASASLTSWSAEDVVGHTAFDTPRNLHELLFRAAGHSDDKATILADDRLKLLALVRAQDPMTKEMKAKIESGEFPRDTTEKVMLKGLSQELEESRVATAKVRVACGTSK